MRCVPLLPRRTDDPILLHRVDDLLQPEQVWLECTHVREQQTETLVPAVGQVSEVERGDVQAVHDEEFAVANLVLLVPESDDRVGIHGRNCSRCQSYLWHRTAEC